MGTAGWYSRNYICLLPRFYVSWLVGIAAAAAGWAGLIVKHTKSRRAQKLI